MRVGTVSDIALEFNLRDMVALIPVYMEFQPERIGFLNGDIEQTTLLQQLQERGMRARLTTLSFVTGQLMVELDFFPGTDGKLVGADPTVPEIATIKSGFEQVKETLEKLPLQDMAATALKVLQHLDTILGSPEIRETLVAAAQSATEARQMMAEIRAEIGPLAGKARETAELSAETMASAKMAIETLQKDLQATLAGVRTVTQSADRELGAISTSTRATLKTAEATLKQAETLLVSLNGLVAPNSAQRYDIDQTLRNLASASRSLKQFAEQLERNPNALVLGKKDAAR